MSNSNTKYELLSEVMELLGEYEKQVEGGEATVVGFSSWLNQRLGYFSLDQTRLSSEGAPYRPSKEQSDQTALTMLITYLYRYAKHYSKKALEGSPLSTLDEFGFLVTLLERKSLTKSELINLHLIEMTSGIEIIKRLTKQGLLDSFPDPDDRRSRRVKLTDEGMQVLMSLMPRLQQVAQIVSADLTSEERGVLLPLLNRLNEFHAVIHHQDRKSDLGEIQAKFLG